MQRPAEMTGPPEPTCSIRVQVRRMLIALVTGLSEIPCRVRITCPAAPRGAAEYRLISGKPYRPWPRVIPREVLGPPSDAVTTDPKGEADRAVVKSGKLIDLQYAGPHQDKAAYGVLAAGSTVDPWGREL